MAYMTPRTPAIMKLAQLQNFIKRDPAAYKDEFLMQKRHFESELEIFKLRPTKDCDRFTELVTFMSHVTSHYQEECHELSFQLIDLMESQAQTLHPEVRSKLLQALIMLRNRGMVDPIVLLKLSFKLFSVPDKVFRESLGEYIFNDIKTVLQEIKRVLEPGGIFVCCVPVPERNRLQSTIRGTLYSEEELAGICKEHGFGFESIPHENGALLYFKALSN